MDFDGIITIVLVCVALWTFIPRHIRHALRSGLEPSIVVIAESVREGTRYTWKLITHLAYQLLIGRTPNNNVIVNYEDDEEEIDDVAPLATTPQNNNNAVATPQNDSNGLLLQAKAESLAIMVKAGKIGETEGIKLVFGVSPSSSNPRYIAARAALKAELERLTNRYPNQTAEQQSKRQELGLEAK